MINLTLYSPGLGYINRGFESLTREIYQSLRQQDDLKITLFQATGEVLQGAVPVWAPKRTSSIYDWHLIRSFKYRQFVSYLLENLFFSVPLTLHCYQNPCDILYFSDAIPANILHRLREKLGGSFKFLFCNGAPANPKDYMHYDYVQVMTPAQYHEAVDAGYPQENLFLIPQGLQCNVYSNPRDLQQRDRWNLPTDRTIVLSVGAISFVHKRMDWLIEEFSKLDPDQFFLWIVGQPELETPKVHSLAATKLKPGSYQFDSVPYAEMPSVYQAADIFTLCSLNEGFGRVYIEAMAAKLPVLAHRNINTEWILGADNLGLIDMTQTDALRDRILYFQQHPTQFDQQRHNNQVIAFERFDWNALIPAYLAMFQTIAPSGQL